MRVLMILFFLCCGSFSIAFGQQICFDEQLSEGDTYLKQGLPQKAIDAWDAAIKQCDLTNSQRTTLNSRIKSAKDAQYVQATPVFVAPETVLVQGGTFQMGSNDGDSDEKPVHSVTLSSFYMGKYEITVAQFKAFIDDDGYKTDAEKDDGSYIWSGSKWEKKAGINWRHDAEGNTRPSSQYNHPVIHVSWNDATAYCAWLSRKTSKTYRLPTEAEWEYAAGNGSKHTKYSWGNGDPSLSKGASVADETGAKKYGWTRNATYIFMNYTDGFEATAPVGSFAANDLGLYDMSGNVWEWCSDWNDAYSSSAQQNPMGATTGSYRVNRGGSWYDGPTNCRVANRSDGTPTNRSYDLGFRLVYSLQ
jgi:formylglycine-generating enzyme